MSLRLVELQVALPRTQDAGKMQEEIQQRGQHQQEQLASLHQKEVERKSKQVLKKDETPNSQVLKDGENTSNGESESKKNNKSQPEDDTVQAQHPYKGNLIDIEG